MNKIEFINLFKSKVPYAFIEEIECILDVYVRAYSTRNNSEYKSYSIFNEYVVYKTSIFKGRKKKIQTYDYIASELLVEKSIELFNLEFIEGRKHPILEIKK